MRSRWPSTWQVPTFLVLLSVLEYIFFFDSFSKFFQGDALFWLQHRFRSWHEFFGGLFTLDVANWYRPLSNRAIPSLCFRWFGLNPYGYHWVVFIAFFVTTCIVFFFLRSVTSSFLAAAFGTVFFALHSINVYVTYDFAFTPELFYAAFYLLSGIAFIRKRYGLSILCFVLAMMSKEAAATLPANLVLLSLLVSRPVGKALKWTVPFFAILAAYYAWFALHLKMGAGDYAISLHKDVLTRLKESWFWAFNSFGREGSVKALLFVSFLIVLAYGIRSLFTARWRWTVLGAAWFVVALTPMLGIVGYFGSYYLFLPLVGVALVVGLALEWLFSAVAAVDRRLAAMVITIVLLPFVASARINARIDLKDNDALGLASRIAEGSLHDLKQARTSVPKGVTFFILNGGEPDLWRFYGLGSLMQLAYADDSIQVLYSSLGHSVPSELLNTDGVIVEKYANEGLVDITQEFTRAPETFLETAAQQHYDYIVSDRFAMQVFPARVTAGKDSYVIRITGAGNIDADLQYRYNGGPIALTTIHLNPTGETKFFVSLETKLGEYRFIAFKLAAEQQWIQTSASVTVVK